eukprot:g3059.t1
METSAKPSVADIVGSTPNDAHRPIKFSKCAFGTQSFISSSISAKDFPERGAVFEPPEVFTYFDRRVNLQSLPKDSSLYQLARAWVQNDPDRIIPQPIRDGVVSELETFYGMPKAKLPAIPSLEKKKIVDDNDDDAGAKRKRTETHNRSPSKRRRRQRFDAQKQNVVGENGTEKTQNVESALQQYKDRVVRLPSRGKLLVEHVVRCRNINKAACKKMKDKAKRMDERLKFLFK